MLNRLLNSTRCLLEALIKPGRAPAPSKKGKEGMKFLKIIGLAAMVAAAVMAVGAATSSATVFCKNNANTETCSEPYKIGTVGVVSNEGSFLLEAGGTVYDTCTSVKVEKEQVEEGSSTTTVKGKVEASDIKLSECTHTTTVLEGGEGEVHWISGTDNGTGTANGGAVTTIITGVSCTYGLGKEMQDWGVLTGGKPASLSVSNSAIKVAGSFLCPSSVQATGKLVLTSPDA